LNPVRNLSTAAVLLGSIFVQFISPGMVSAENDKPSGASPAAKAKGPPPTLVTTALVTPGVYQPMQELVGTVFFSKVSKVAAETDGVVERIWIEDGDRIKRGAPLVALRSELLDKTIEGTRLSYEETLVELEKGRTDLERIEALFQDQTVSKSVYDEHVFRTRSLEMKSGTLKTSLDRLLIEKEQKSITAPFAGVVLDRNVEVGEWVSPGGTVATLADDETVDVVVDVPESLLSALKPGQKVSVQISGRKMAGVFHSLIPRGNIATRTFPVKIRVENQGRFMEGMEARATLPAGPKRDGLVVPRDAVIHVNGKDVLFSAVGSTARMVPVSVIGREGQTVAVTGPGLEPGQQVVVKGHERLRDGQPIRTP